MAATNSKTVVYAAAAGNLLVALTKFAAAWWTGSSAMLSEAIHSVVDFYEGVEHILHPHPIVDAHVSYIVYACAFLFEGATWIYARREFAKAKGDAGYVEAIIRSKDPPSFIVLLEDSAALIGLAIAAVGTFAAEYYAQPALDGLASIGISLVLALTACALARESKGLLIGEPA